MDENTRLRIETSILKNPGLPDHRISKNLRGTTTADVRQVRESIPGVQQSGNGITLSNKRVLSRKPAESAAKFIKRLPDNKGFEPSELSKEWGIGEETIRKHARDLNCLRFVEIEEDEWRQLVLHPETASHYQT